MVWLIKYFVIKNLLTFYCLIIIVPRLVINEITLHLDEHSSELIKLRSLKTYGRNCGEPVKLFMDILHVESCGTLRIQSNVNKP